MALPRARLGKRCCGEKMQCLEARAGQGETKSGHALSAVQPQTDSGVRGEGKVDTRARGGCLQGCLLL